MTRMALATLILLAGCARETESFPSLAPRPIEKLNTAEPVAPPAIPAPADPAIAAQTATLLAEAEAGGRDFAAALAQARPRIRAAAGAANGSEAWVSGQEALSRLTAARNRTAAALQSLDALAMARNDDPAVTPARDRAAALDTAQEASLAGLETAPSQD